MKVIIKITDGTRTYMEDVTKDQKEYFDEISTNGANPELTTFEQWARVLKEMEFTTENLNKYNTRDEDCHFISGWAETFAQSEDVPGWMTENELKISVLNQ